MLDYFAVTRNNTYGGLTMKKQFLFLFVVFIVLSCGGRDYFSVTVTNNSDSDRTVTYTYNGAPRTIPPGITNSYNVRAFTDPPIDILDHYGIASIHMERTGDAFSFTDARPLYLYVTNTLPTGISIEADSYIDNGVRLIGYSPLILLIGSSETKKALIYTRKPAFTSDPGLPIAFAWEITNYACDEDCDETCEGDLDTMQLIIR